MIFLKRTSPALVWASLRAAFPKTVPVMTGYVFLGIAFGLLVRNAGYPLWLAPAMSMFIFSGSLQFAALPMLAAPFDPLGSWLLGVMISARHIFYGLPFIERYKHTGILRPFLIYGLTDENFSILTALHTPEGIPDKWFAFWITVLDYFYWVFGCTLGAIGGEVIPFDLTGLDFALTGLFVVLFVEQMKGRSGIISGCIGIPASLAALFLFGPDKMVLGSMGFIALALLIGKRWISDDRG